MTVTAESPRLTAIRAFAAARFPLVPLCSTTTPHEHHGKPCTTSRGKVPIRADYPAIKAGEYGADNLPANYGVVLSSSFVVVDVDPRNFAPGDRPLARLAELCGAFGGPLGNTFTVRTGGGGLHIYLRKPDDVVVRNSVKEFPGIEFKSAGRQVVGPGSVHALSGKEYAVVAGSPTTIAEAPAALLALIIRNAVPFSDVGTGTYRNDAQAQARYVAFLQDVAQPSVEGKGGDHNAFRVAAAGRDLGLPPATTWDLMLEVWNPKCSPPWTPDDLKDKVIHAYKYAAGAVGAAHPEADFEGAPVIEEGDPADPLAPKANGVTNTPDSNEIAWVRQAKTGALIKCFQNLILFLKFPAAGLAGVFGYNEFTGRVEFTKPAPWHRGRMPASLGVSDHDLKLFKGYLAMRYGFEMPIQNIEEAVTVVAHDNRFHPVRSYLDALTWDGTPRLERWLTEFLGVDDSPYTRACARKVLCAAVARVYRPGVKFDHVLVLEGLQGIGKSSVCRILAGPWAADFPVDPHDKDTIQLMQGKWVIELAEMEPTRRADMQSLKAFISRTKDEARLAYGRTVGEFPRQSIFIGSINPSADGTYLSDDENRRWWPVRCDPPRGQVDFARFKASRDQLFAEAVSRVKNKQEPLYMETTELKADAKVVAAMRHAEHAWTERISSWMHESQKNPDTRRDFLTARDVYVEAMSGVDKQLDRRACIAIAQVLRELGWEATTHRTDEGRVVRGYMRVGREKKAVVSPNHKIPKNILDILGDLA